MTVYKAWYVAESDLLTTAHHDFSERLPIREGETLTLPDSVTPKVCRLGYHACPRLLDAFGYRTEGVITLVEISGNVSVGNDKIAGRSRKTLRIVSQAIADRECRLFAADVAERLLLAERKAGREPAEESWTAVEIARRFALGDASRGKLAKARRAARAATEATEEAAAVWWAAEASRAAAGATEEAARASTEAATEAAEAAAWAEGAEAGADLSAELEARILKAIGEEP